MHTRLLMTWRTCVGVTAATCLWAGCSSGPDKEATDPPPDSPSSSSVQTQQLSFLTDSAVERVDARVEVPEGFEEGDDWYVVSADGDTFLGLWTTTSVERDACLPPTDDDVVPGPSVDDLASALVEQGSTDATEPKTSALAGYQGVYLELTGPADRESCGEGPGLANARGFYSDDQLDRLWILDVDGQRVVVDASTGPTSSGSELEALTSMVESLEIVTDAR